MFSGITLLSLQRQTISKAVDALVDKELLEKSIQSIVDKQVSVLVRLSQSSIQHTIQRMFIVYFKCIHLLHVFLYW